MNPQLYSQWVRSTVDNLDLPLVSEEGTSSGTESLTCEACINPRLIVSELN